MKSAHTPKSASALEQRLDSIPPAVTGQCAEVFELVQVGNDARLEARPERRKTAATQAEPKKGRFEP